MQSKTTIAGIIIVVSWIACVILVKADKATFDEAVKALLGIFALIGGWGLYNAQDNNNNPPPSAPAL
jgi:hypothetical protein